MGRANAEHGRGSGGLVAGHPSFLSKFSLLLGRLTVSYVPGLAFSRCLPLLTCARWYSIRGSCITMGHGPRTHPNIVLWCRPRHPRHEQHVVHCHSQTPMFASRSTSWPPPQRRGMRGGACSAWKCWEVGSTIRRRRLSAEASAPTRVSSRLGSRLPAPGGDSDDSGGLVALGRKTPPCPCCVPMSTTIRSRSRTCQIESALS